MAGPTNEPRIGLALGGGGARGLAHILALQAFDELGLKPALIAGTSIGAIIGAGYAAGLSAQEIRERAETLLGRRRDILRNLFALPPRTWSELWTLRPFAQSAMNPEALLGLVFPETMAAGFADLRVPLLVVATDFYAQTRVVMSSGALVPAVAASMALPGLFRPVQHEHRILVDGGLTNPLPFDLLKPGADVSVAIDVIGGPSAENAGQLPSAMEALIATSQIMQKAIVQEKLALAQPDLLLRPPVWSYRVLDFHKVREILATATPWKDELKHALEACLSGGRRRNP
jgi:NTE family protein